MKKFVRINEEEICSIDEFKDFRLDIGGVLHYIELIFDGGHRSVPFEITCFDNEDEISFCEEETRDTFADFVSFLKNDKILFDFYSREKRVKYKLLNKQKQV